MHMVWLTSIKSLHNPPAPRKGSSVSPTLQLFCHSCSLAQVMEGHELVFIPCVSVKFCVYELLKLRMFYDILMPEFR